MLLVSSTGFFLIFIVSFLHLLPFFYPYAPLFLSWIMSVFNYYYYDDDNHGDFIVNSC